MTELVGKIGGPVSSSLSPEQLEDRACMVPGVDGLPFDYPRGSGSQAAHLEHRQTRDAPIRIDLNQPPEVPDGSA